MAEGPAEGRFESEILALREELRALRTEQREMARAIDQLVQTFRSLAVHLGIAAEPYQKSAGSSSPKDLPGFA